MQITNCQYYMTIDNLGLKFVDANKEGGQNNTEYRLAALNKMGLRFVMAISLRHQLTDLPVVIAIFEETD